MHVLETLFSKLSLQFKIISNTVRLHVLERLFSIFSLKFFFSARLFVGSAWSFGFFHPGGFFETMSFLKAQCLASILVGLLTNWRVGRLSVL